MRLPRPFAELLRDLPTDRLEAGLHADLCDPGTHRAEPDDPDPADLHGARSYSGRCASTHRKVALPSGSAMVSSSSDATSSPASRTRCRVTSGS